MNLFWFKPFAVLPLLIGSLLISPAFFTAFGGAVAIVFLRAGFWVIFSTLFLEIFSGLPVGVVSIPLALANIAAEVLRGHLYDRSFASSSIIFLTTIFTFLVSHIIVVSIV